MSDAEDAIVEWVNTFKDLPSRAVAISDLADGVLLYEMLSQIAPKFFDADMDGIKRDVGSNWMLRLNNLKKLIKHLSSFYDEVLSTTINLNGIDLTAIAKSNDKKSLFLLIEWVLGAAVQCEDKNTFIMEIMKMDEASQREIMHTVQSIMEKSSEAAPSPSRELSTSVDNVDGGKGELEALRNEKEARDAEMDKMKKKIKAMELELEDLKREKTNSKSKPSSSVSSPAGKDEEKSNSKALAQALARLETAESTVKELNQLLSDKEKQLSNKLKISEEKQANLEENLRRQADELDITKSQLAQASRSEATLQKLKSKMEDMDALKEQIKSLEIQNSGYLEKIFDFEASGKNQVNLKSQLDSYKDKVVNLEISLSKSASEQKVKDDELKSLRGKISNLETSKQFLEEQIESLKHTNEELQFEIKGGGNSTSGIGLDLSGSSDVRERLARLERENKQLREGGGGVEGKELADNKFLENEIDDLKRVKVRLEQTASDALQRAGDLERQLNEANKRISSNTTTITPSLPDPSPSNDKAIAKLTEKLLAYDDEIKSLKIKHQETTKQKEEELLKKEEESKRILKQKEEEVTKKEEEVAKMNVEKTKLENYIKQALTHANSNIKKMEKDFAQKEQQSSDQISRQRDMLAEKDDQLKWFKKQSDETKEMHKREERLMFSAVHQAGFEILKLHQPSNSTRAFKQVEGVPEMESWLSREREKKKTNRKA